MNWEYFFTTYISPIGEIGIFLATLILLFLTYKYLRFTRRMANVMAEEFEIKVKPIVEVTERSSVTGDTFEYVYEIVNKGSFVVHFRHIETKCWHLKHPNKQASLNLININKHISPGSSEEVHNNFTYKKLIQAMPDGVDITDRILNIQVLFNFVDIKGNEFEKEMSFQQGI